VDNGNLQETDVERSQGQDKCGRTDPETVDIPVSPGHDPGLPLGLFLWPPRYIEQALPEQFRHHQSQIIGSASRLLRHVPAGIARSRQLDRPKLWLQASLYLGRVSVWCEFARRLALYPLPVIRRLLCGHLHHRQRSGRSRHRGESIHHSLRPTSLRRVTYQHLVGFSAASEPCLCQCSARMSIFSRQEMMRKL